MLYKKAIGTWELAYMQISGGAGVRDSLLVDGSTAVLEFKELYIGLLRMEV